MFGAVVEIFHQSLEWPIFRHRAVVAAHGRKHLLSFEPATRLEIVECLPGTVLFEVPPDTAGYADEYVVERIRVEPILKPTLLLALTLRRLYSRTGVVSNWSSVNYGFPLENLRASAY